MRCLRHGARVHIYRIYIYIYEYIFIYDIYIYIYVFLNFQTHSRTLNLEAADFFSLSILSTRIYGVMSIIY